MIRHLSLLLAFAWAVASAMGSPNVIKDSSVVVNAPLTDEEISQIIENKRWPYIGVTLGGAATMDAFASLQKLDGLRELKIVENELLTDLEPIAALPDLVELDVLKLIRTDLEPWSLAPLAQCPKLFRLQLYAFPVKDEQALAACQNLGIVEITNVEMQSITWLGELSRVVELGLSESKANYENYAPLAKLTHLRKLSLYGHLTPEALEPLSQLESIQEFRAQNSGDLTSLDFLRNCQYLEEVYVGSSRNLADISALADKQFLRSLYIGGTAVTSLDALTGLVRLRSLNLHGAKIEDLSPLASTRALEDLDLTRCPVSDLTPLKNLNALTSVALTGTAVHDLSPLSDHPYIKTLRIAGTEVTDLSVLANLPNLVSAQLDNLPPESYAPLAECLSLTRVQLGRDTPAATREHITQIIPQAQVW